MKIEIYGSNKSAENLCVLRENFINVIEKSKSLIMDLRLIQTATTMMSGGVGSLQNAVDLIENKIAFEEQRQDNIAKVNQKLDSFIKVTHYADRSAAELVSQNNNEFYRLNKWAKPATILDEAKKWYDNAKNWLKEAANVIGEEFAHGWKIATETKLNALSDEELDEYCKNIIEKIKSGEFSNDDEIRLSVLLKYLSQTELKPNMSEHDKEKIRLFNEIYEAIPENKSEAQNINDFFANSGYNNDGTIKEGLTKEDIENIKFIAYNSKEDCHKIFFENISNCHVESWHHVKNDGKGNLVSADSYYRSSPEYNKETGKYEEIGVYLTLNLDGYGINNPRGAYHTFFHEIGHNIDDLLCDDITNPDGSITKRNFSTHILENGNFFDSIYSDVESNFKRAIEDYNNNEAIPIIKIKEEGQKKILDVLMGKKEPSSLDPRLSFAYRKIYEDYTGKWKGAFTQHDWNGKETGILEGADNNMISDITGGITNNAVMGSYGHREYPWYIDVDSNGNVIDRNGDGKFDENDALRKGDLLSSNSVPLGMQESEFFAEYFAYEMTQDPDANKARKYFQKSYAIIDKALSEKVESK